MVDSNEPDESGTFTLKIKSKSDEHEGTQRKTFTKWLNSQLAKTRCRIPSDRADREKPGHTLAIHSLRMTRILN
ncbi:Spectrin beta chain, non-erythrocytic 1 [Exaiptasia diaphana]|nr:Spectrin beta chain, non-erythrocytic 1 [Exaiptasia diaphana]